MTMLGKRPVVVGVDGSPAADQAATYGAWEARRRGADLYLLHAFPSTSLAGGVVVGNDQATLTWARDMMARTEARIRDEFPDLRAVLARVIAGSPAAVLRERSRYAALTVVGARGRGRLTHKVIGSVAGHLVGHAFSPTVVVPPVAHPSGPYGTGPIVVGVDGTHGADDALAFGFDQAAARGVGLWAVYVWSTLPRTNLGPVNGSGFSETEARDEARRMLAEQMAGWSEKYPDIDVIQLAAHSYNPVLTLCEVADAAGLIVVGPRSRAGFTGLMPGSLAEGLIRHGHSAVAVARHGAGR
jgi:nucleotide-binding universal stress UspA family protein